MADRAGFEPAGHFRSHGLASRCLGPLDQRSRIFPVTRLRRLSIFETDFRKKATRVACPRSLLVRAAGFEPATPWSQTRCAARLRQARVDDE